MAEWTRTGAVFRLPGDDRDLRVLVADSGVVAYDAWRPDLDAWGLGDLASVRRRSVSYYVARVATVQAKGEHRRDDPLSTAEEHVHRPDLPFTLLADEDASWGDVPPGSAMPGVAAPALWVVPHGPRGGRAKGVRVEGDADGIDGRSLLAAAARAVADAGSPDVRGVGLHRLGLQRGVPSFYAWGARSRLEDG